MKNKKRVLVAPLDWGLGHAARCVPLICTLLEEGAEVLLAASGRPAHLLRSEFPSLEMIDLPGYGIRYPASRNMALHFALAAPGILQKIRSEHRSLEKIIAEKKTDIVISDNRFGLWSENARCIYISHQLQIKAPAGGLLLNRLHRRYMKRYDEVWVPDFPEAAQSLSGDLGHPSRLPANTFYIGPLSRFREISGTRAKNEDIPAAEILVLLSGPEPQRSMLEEILLPQLSGLPQQILFVRGVTESDETRKINGNLVMTDHLDTAKLTGALRHAQTVICRSGYSTLCDLAVFGKKAIVIPTPGQTEQEYLAVYHALKNRLVVQQQEKLLLPEAFGSLPKTTGLHIPGMNERENLLRKKVRELLG